MTIEAPIKPPLKSPIHLTGSAESASANPSHAHAEAKPLSDRRAHHAWLTSGQLKEHWYAACTDKELKRNDCLSIKILGLGLVIFRGADQRIGALIDQCVHRGTALSGGKLNDGCITCPYHGWRYNTEGQVVHVPSIDGDQLPTHPHRFSQRSFPTQVSGGLIWVYLGQLPHQDKQPFEMPFHDTPGWITYYMRSKFSGSVGALAQNFMDVPHTVFVHNKIFRKSPQKLMRTTVDFTPHSVEVDYEDAGDSIGMMPWLTNPDKVPLVHTDQFHSPNNTRCDYHWGDTSAFVITSTITPETEHTSRVFTLISYKLPVPQVIARMLRPLIHVYTRIVLEQDIRIMKVNRRGISNAPASKMHSVQSDIVHIGIERLIDAAHRGEPLDKSKLGRKPMNFNL